jgi:xylulokinase
VSVFVGIDVGTSSTKVIAVDEIGKVLTGATSPHPLHSPKPGWIEQDPHDWWKSVRRATRQMVAQLPGGAPSITCVGLSGHMSSLVALDAKGQPMRPCITVADTRARSEVAELNRRFGRDVVGLTGSPPSTSDTASTLLWIKHHEPDVYGRLSTFLFAKDYLRLRLTGRSATEPTDAGNSGFLDLLSRRWDGQLFEAMGHERRVLPELVDTTAIVGQVTRAGAETGLLEGTPVVAGAADMAASMLGAGALDPGVMAVTIGTSAQVTTPVTKPFPAARGRIDFHPHAVPGLLYALGSVFSGGLTVQWLDRCFGATSKAARSSDLGGLTELAAGSDAGSGGAIFLPFLVGSGSPDFDADSKASFLGLTLGAGKPQLVRAVLEGVAHDIRRSVDAMTDLGLPVETVHMAGGGAASMIWCQIVASMLDRPVRLPAVRDASVLGAAVLAAVGAGTLPDVRTATAAMVHLAEEILPDPSAAERYAADHQLFLRAKELVAELDRRRVEWSDVERGARNG